MIVLSLVFLATAYGSAFAHPSVRRDVSVTLPLEGGLNLARLASIVESDQARAVALMQRPHVGGQKRRSPSTSVDATNTAVYFTVQVGIGEPASQYTLLLDTGSGNTWVGANSSNPYHSTSTSHNTGKSSVNYGSGSFSGTEYTDKLDLGNGLVINDQSIGAANKTSGFEGDFDGILGIGPTDLTTGTLSDSDQSTVPTVVDGLKSQGKIREEILGMFYPPYAEQTSGSVTFGGVDDSHYTGPLSYVPITKTEPAGYYFGVNQTISYGDVEITSGAVSGIVDSGTSLILLASDHFKAYAEATGATQDSNTKMLSLPKDQFRNIKPLNFHIGDKTWTLNANAQIWPRSLNTALGGDDDHVYFVVGNLGERSGSGFDFINGYMFMQRFYTVFDSSNSRVGFATTKYTNSEAN
ncbi:hypothetical protein PHLGIDRAFT_245515 [Phlebiopsis gigantea 11061_1 CR5-6]|uniref:Peptidase A1 domain-containing protein n=1 Tax=Phlebiopsis gigantea (strain 11061_1 CR5-6) TaxID=745531 RepID=A0A0C3S543_PHLG1|nr:hypothetical protein PHLGIDRAFT_245515 [Phlebiopsis gigantea 11061_1 CR5-6]